MYIQTGETLGQTQLPSTSNTPCLQDETPLEFIYLNTRIIEKTLDEFNFRKSGLRTKHRTWLRNHLAARIVHSWHTNTPIRTIILIGHTDEAGDQSDNYKLGLKRAEAVRNQIIKEIPKLAAKITIKIYSSGECWPLVRSGKRERRNRRVEVFALSEAFPPASHPAPPTPSSPPKRQRPIKLLELPESVRKRIIQEDERRRLTEPVPTRPRGRSLKEWFERIMNKHNVPRWLRNRIWDAALGGDQNLVSILLDRAGIRGDSKKAILGIIHGGSQVPIP